MRPPETRVARRIRRCMCLRGGGGVCVHVPNWWLFVGGGMVWFWGGTGGRLLEYAAIPRVGLYFV